MQTAALNFDEANFETALAQFEKICANVKKARQEFIKALDDVVILSLEQSLKVSDCLPLNKVGRAITAFDPKQKNKICQQAISYFEEYIRIPEKSILYIQGQFMCNAKRLNAWLAQNPNWREKVDQTLSAWLTQQEKTPTAVNPRAEIKKASTALLKKIVSYGGEHEDCYKNIIAALKEISEN